MKDPTDFRKRVAAYRLGKLPYLAGRPVDDDEEEFLSTYDFIKKFEGDRDTVYLDSKGIKTVGMGFTDKELIKAVEARRVGNKPGKITDEERLIYYNKHITEAEDTVRSKVPLYDKMSPEARTALLSYYYNYPAGYKGGYLTNESYVKRPTRFIEALHNRDYKTAAKEMDAGMNDKNSPGLRTRRLEELKYFLHDGSPIPSQRPITITLDKRRKAFDKLVGNTVEYTRLLVLDADETIAKRSKLKPPFIKKYADGKSPYDDDRVYTTSDYVLPELVITPTKDSPEELAIEQAYLDRFKNKRLEIPVDNTAAQEHWFRLGILEQRDTIHNSPWMWGLRGLVAAPVATVGLLAGQTISLMLTNPYVDAALTSAGGAHAIESIKNGEADWMTALEIAPLMRLVKPFSETISGVSNILHKDVRNPYKVSNAVNNETKGNVVESINQGSINNTKTKDFSILDLPGYQLKGLMRGNPLEKLLSKSGTISVNSIKALAAKGSNVEKVVVDKVLSSEQFAGQKAVDYNAFRKAVQDELITYKTVPSKQWEDYGIKSLGFKDHATHDAPNIRFNEATGEFEQVGEFTEFKPDYKLNTFTFESPRIPVGNDAHYNMSTLGHSRTYTTTDEPEVLHVMESLSDWGLLTKDLSPKFIFNRAENGNTNVAFDANGKFHFVEDGEGMPYRDFMNLGLPTEQMPFTIAKTQYMENYPALLVKHLHDNYLQRLLQENLKYAAEHGQTKMRYPTPETAAKIEGYKPKTNYGFDSTAFDALTTNLQKHNKQVFEENNWGLEGMRDGWIRLFESNPNDEYILQHALEGMPLKYDATTLDLMRKARNSLTKTSGYIPEHQTILKKYSDFPKMYGKLYKGAEVRTVTDAKGNTWYEVDVPKNYLKQEWVYGLSVPAAVGIGATHHKKIQKKHFD